MYGTALALKGQVNKKQRIKNMAIWIHLSACTTASHGYFGIDEPGKHNNTSVIKNQPIAGIKRINATE
jgi:hypothetical protein